MARQTGVTVKIIDTARLAKSVDFQRTGIIRNSRGEIRTINTEGVQDALKDGAYAVYTWGGYGLYSHEEILAAETDEEVDLSVFVREFGQRLETNFYLAHQWATNTEGE